MFSLTKSTKSCKTFFVKSFSTHLRMSMYMTRELQSKGPIWLSLCHSFIHSFIQSSCKFLQRKLVTHMICGPVVATVVLFKDMRQYINKHLTHGIAYYSVHSCNPYGKKMYYIMYIIIILQLGKSFACLCCV